MYEVYSTIEGKRVCLFDDTVSNLEVKLIDPVLTLEDSAAGSLEFKLMPNNIAYNEYTFDVEMVDHIDQEGNVVMRTVTKTVDLVERLQSVITVLQNGVEIWEGRVLTEERDFDNTRSIYCEGELAYLNDTCQVAKLYHDITLRQFIQAILSIHNSRVDDRKKFYVGVCEISDNLETSARETQYQKTMAVINDIVESNKCHMYISKSGGKRYLNFVKDYNGASAQTIQFGKNLLDFTCKWDMAEMCSAILATGAITENGSSSQVGKPLTPNDEGGVPAQYQLLYLNQGAGTVSVETGSNLGGYRVGRFTVEPNKNYYVSCRLHGGFVAYCCWKNDSGNYQILNHTEAGSDSQIGFTDFVDQKFTTPAGCNEVWVCSFGDDIPVSLKDEGEVVNELDQYLTVEDCDDDIEYDEDDNPIGVWHQKGSMYITSPELLSKYGWIEKQVQFEDTEDKDELYTKAKAYLESGQFDNLTIEVKAIDLTILGVNVAAIKLLDQVRVISPPHGLDKLFPVTKLEIPLATPEDQTFTIGTDTDQTLTGVNNDVNSELLAKVDAIPSYSATLESAKENAAAMIASATNGYVTLVQNDQGQTREIVISNTPDPTDCTSCWIWNEQGLGHSDHYPLSPGDTVNVAMTMDGAIVADRVTTGTLASINIRGCNVNVGGMDNTDGTVMVRNSSGSDYCAMLKHGGVYFGFITRNGNQETVKDFAWIRDNKEYNIGTLQDPQLVRGLVIGMEPISRGAGVLALDVDSLWVGTAAGNDAAGTITGSMILMSADGRPFKIDLRHGMVIGDDYDPNQQDTRAGLTQTVTVGDMDLEFRSGILVAATQRQQNQNQGGGSE